MKYINYVTFLACVSGIITTTVAHNYLALLWAVVATISTLNVCLRQAGYR